MEKISSQHSLNDVLGPVRQLGHVVEDIHASMQAWEQRGVGPWLLMRNVCLKSEYQGQPSRPVIDVALSYQGEMQIELIQQHNDAQSPYLTTRERGEFGLHHQAFLCADIQQAVEQAQARGYQLLCDIHMVGSRYVYMQGNTAGEADAPQFVELLPASFMMKTMISRGVKAAAKWQGAGAPLVIDMQNVATLLTSLPGAARARLSW